MGGVSSVMDRCDPDFDPVGDAAYWERKSKDCFASRRSSDSKKEGKESEDPWEEGKESENPWEEEDYEYVQASEAALRWRKKADALKRPLVVYEARLVEIENKLKEVKQQTGKVPASTLTVRNDIKERRNLYLYHMNAAEDLARDFAQLTRIHRSLKAQVI